MFDESIYPFLLNVGISLSASLVVTFYIRTVAHSAIANLCKSGQGGLFWVKLLDINLILVPLTLVSLFNPVRPNIAFALILASQLAVLLMMGRSIWKLIQPEQSSPHKVDKVVIANNPGEQP